MAPNLNFEIVKDFCKSQIKSSRDLRWVRPQNKERAEQTQPPTEDELIAASFLIDPFDLHVVI
jgi:hypothetical protein